jgi:hypothetical protein
VYVTAFVQPISGETFWYVSNGVSQPFFAALLALFAREAGAGRERIIVLGLDNAGWHTEPNLVVPEGLRPVYLPRARPNGSPPSTSGLSWMSRSPIGTSQPWPLSSKSSPRVVVFSIAISSNPAQTSTGGPSQTSRPNCLVLGFDGAYFSPEMVHSSRQNGRRHYGPSSSWERPHDCGSASSDTA